MEGKLCVPRGGAGAAIVVRQAGTGTPLGLGVGAEGKGRWLLLRGISSFVRGKVK